MASRLGPARPRAIGCDGAGGSVMPSQSRQENFSRTCSTTFQRRGSRSGDSVTVSESLRRFGRPHLPQALFLGLGLLKIEDGELELFDDVLAALRRLPELFSPQLGEHEFQPLDLKRPDVRF